MTRAYDNAVDARYPSGRRNLIINGAMEVAQRGTTGTQAVNYVIDRWRYNVSGSTGSVTQNTFTVGQIDVDPALEYYATFDVTAGNDNCNFQQRIEGVKRVPAGPVTVSFWAKGTNPADGTKVFLAQYFGSSGSSSVEITPQEITMTSSWQKFELTFTVPSISGKTVAGGDDFFGFNIGQHTSTSTAAYEINITGVQLEVGTVATPFEHRSYGEELLACQRYLNIMRQNGSDSNIRYCSGVCANSTAGEMAYVVYPELRSTPALSVAAAANYRVRSDAARTCTSVGSDNRHKNGVNIQTTVSGGQTSGFGANLDATSSSSFIELDAEL